MFAAGKTDQRRLRAEHRIDLQLATKEPVDQITGAQLRLNHAVDLTFSQQLVSLDGRIDFHDFDVGPLAVQPVSSRGMLDDRHGAALETGQAFTLRLNTGDQYKRIDDIGTGKRQAILTAGAVGQGCDQTGWITLGAAGHGLHRGYFPRPKHQPCAVVDHLQQIGRHAA
ncbi:hypothetical protein D3C73_1275030 [compost metagenome]